MTMGTYAKAVTADKRNAQDAIAALFVENDDNQQRDARKRRLDLFGPSLWLIGPLSGANLLKINGRDD
jgi:hypothetical protein